MNLRKRIISVFISACMIFSFASMAFQAGAEEEVAYGYSDFTTYSSSDDHVSEIIEDMYLAKAALKSGLDSLQRSINVRGMGLTKDNVDDFYFDFLFDNPQYFYVFTSYKFTYSSADQSVISIMPQYITSENKPGEDTAEEVAQQNIEIGEMKELFDKNTAELMSCIDDSMSDTEKLLALHDALASHVAYSKVPAGKYSKSIYTAYGAIAEGSGVCQSYSLAYSYLAKLAGIEDIQIVSNKYHSWNMVNLDDQWYHVDVTFDDPYENIQGRVMHKYFLISDSKLKENDSSSDHDPWTPAYSATSTVYDSGDYFWLNTTSQIIFDGGRVYYVDMPDSETGKYKTAAIKERDSEGQETVIAEVKDKWMSNGGGYYNANFTRLFKEGDYLYFNNPKSVMRISITDGNAETLYTLSDEIKDSCNIFGLAKGEDVIYVSYAGEPNEVMTIEEFAYVFGDGTTEEPSTEEPDEPSTEEPDEPENPTDPDKPGDPVTEYEIGDVNKDGIIDIIDATEIQKYLAQLNNNMDIVFADVDGNGTISIDDSTAIQKILVHLI